MYNRQLDGPALHGYGRTVQWIVNMCVIVSSEPNQSLSCDLKDTEEE